MGLLWELYQELHRRKQNAERNRKYSSLPKNSPVAYDVYRKETQKPQNDVGGKYERRLEVIPVDKFDSD